MKCNGRNNRFRTANPLLREGRAHRITAAPAISFGLRSPQGKRAMVKAKGKNTSQSIRDFLTANPGAKAKEVVEALAKAGVKTNEGLVYAVKGGMKEKKRRKKRVVKAAMAATKASSNGQASKPDAIT